MRLRGTPRARVAALVFCAAIGACESTAPPPPPPAANLALSSVPENPVVGALLPDPIVATVTDASGGPTPGALVHWTVTGGGRVSSDTTRTDPTGKAVVQWTLGPIAGTQELQARLANLPVATISVASQPGSPVNLDVKPDTVRFTAYGQARQLTIIATDRFGNRVLKPRLVWPFGGPNVSVTPFTRTSPTDPPSTDTSELVMTSYFTTGGWVQLRLDDDAGVHTQDSVYVIMRLVVARASFITNPQILTPGDSGVVIAWSALDSLGSSINGLNAQDAGLSFSSSAPAVATVDSNGLVRARAAGQTTIRATRGDQSAESSVTVVTRVELGPPKQVAFSSFFSRYIQEFAFSADGITHTLEPNFEGGGPGSHYSYLTSTDLAGTIRWRRTYSRVASGLVEGPDATVYVVDYDAGGSFVDAIKTDGTLRNHIALPACGDSTRQYWRPITVTNNNDLLAASSSNSPADCLTRIAPDGSRIWMIPLPARTSVLTKPGRIYAVDGTRISALDDAGTVVWQRDMPWSIASAILDSDGAVYLASATQGQVISLSAQGIQRWSITTSDNPQQLLMDGSGNFFVLAGTTLTSAVAAVGSVRWATTLPLPVGGTGLAVAGDDGRIYIGSRSSLFYENRATVYVVNAATGTLLGRTGLLLDVGIDQSLAAADGLLFVAGGSGVIALRVDFRPARAWSQLRGNPGRTNSLPPVP